MEIFIASQASAVLADICNNLRKKLQGYRVAFITTASNLYANPVWLQKDKQKLIDLGFSFTEIDIAKKNPNQLEHDLSGVDIIYVAGGNTMYLLEQAIASGFDKLVKALVAKGTIYIGSSAGSVILAPDIEPSKNFDERPGGTHLKQTKGLGLVDFVPLPHWGKEGYGDINEKVLTQYSAWKYKIKPLTDSQYWYVKGTDIRFHDVSKPQ